MLNLILAVLSSALVAIVIRSSKSHIKNDIGLLAANYLFCTVFAWIDTGFAAPFPACAGLAKTLGLGAVNGFLFLAGFVLLQWSLKSNGVVLSATFQKLGLLVALLASVFIFGEKPALWQWFAFGLAIVAILLMNYQPSHGKAGNTAGLVLLLLACGCCDTLSKVYETYGNADLSGHFLLYTFLTAFLLCLCLLAFRRQSLPGKAEWLWGLLVGAPNYYSAKFLLAALSDLPAVIVYPVFNTATLLVVTLAGLLLFRERLKKSQWIALGLILVVLVLLNL